MRTSGARWSLSLATSLTLLASGFAASPASAAPVTAPVITVNPIAKFEVVYDSLDLDGNTLTDQKSRTFSGTSTGTTGDLIDLVCAISYGGFYTASNDIPVNANGTWSTTFDIEDTLWKAYGGNCKFEAIWDGTTPTPYADSMATEHVMGMMYVDAIGGVPGAVSGASLYMEGASYVAAFASISRYPLTFRTPDSLGQLYKDRLFSTWAASVGGSVFEDETLVIDGAAATMGGNYQMYGTATAANKAVDIDFSINPDTGDFVYTETAPIYACHVLNTGSPRTEGCKVENELKPTGVSVTRETHFDAESITLTMYDTYSSTDGNSHTVTVKMYEAFDVGQADFSAKFEDSVSGIDSGWNTANDVIPATITDFDGLTSIELRRDPNSPISNVLIAGRRNVGAQVMYYPAPDRIEGKEKYGSDMFWQTVWANRTINPSTDFKMATSRTLSRSSEEFEDEFELISDLVREIDPTQTIVWNPANNVVVGTTSLGAAATSNQGGMITYSIKDAGDTECTIDEFSGAVSFRADGECVIEVQADYVNPATPKGYGWRKTKAEYTITVGEEAPLTGCPTSRIGRILFGTGGTELDRGDKNKLLKVLRKAAKAGCTTLRVVGHSTKSTNKKDLEEVRAQAARERAQSTIDAGVYYSKKYDLGLTFIRAIVRRGDDSPVDKTSKEQAANRKAEVFGVAK